MPLSFDNNKQNKQNKSRNNFHQHFFIVDLTFLPNDVLVSLELYDYSRLSFLLPSIPASTEIHGEKSYDSFCLCFMISSNKCELPPALMLMFILDISLRPRIHVRNKM